MFMRVVKTIKWFLIFSALVLTIFLGSILLSYPKKSGIIPISDPIQSLGSNEEPKKYNIIEAYDGNNLDFTPFGINGTESIELTNMLNEEIGEGELNTTVTGTITSVAEYTQILITRLAEALKDDPDELEEYVVSSEIDDSSKKLLGANEDKVKVKEKKVKVKDLINQVIDTQIVKDDNEQFANQE